MYSLDYFGSVVKDGGMQIPPFEDNIDYQAYLAWVAKGNKPTPYKQSEQEEYNQWKAERARAVAKIVVYVDDMGFDGDETSQNRMARCLAALADGESITWTLSDNTVAQVTKSQLLAALRSAGEEQTKLWIKEIE